VANTPYERNHFKQRNRIRHRRVTPKIRGIIDVFEVKLTASPTVRDIQNLLIFMEEYPETVRGVLVHGGDKVQWLHSRVIAVPWWWLDV